MASVLIGGWEVFLRSAGYKHNVTNDLTLWCLWRDQVHKPNTIVILGSSRAQLGMDINTLNAHLPNHNIVNLAMVGRWDHTALLRDLADDEQFSGLVVAECNEHWFTPGCAENTEDMTRYYEREWSLNKKANRLLSAGWQQTMVTGSSPADLVTCLNRLFYKHNVTPPIEWCRFDRSYEIEAARAAAPPAAGAPLPQVEKRTAPPEGWMARVRELEPYVKRIQQRGGNVVMVRMPTSGAVLRSEERSFPLALYWKNFKANTPATCMHFKEVRKMAKLKCYDDSHLAGQDSRLFTEELARQLSMRGMVPGQLAMMTEPKPDSTARMHIASRP